MYALIPAAGSSSRMGGLTSERSKIFLPLHRDGVSVLRATIRSIVESGVCTGIIVLTKPDDVREAEEALRIEAPGLDCSARPGGKTRQESVWLGLESLREKEAAKAEFILIHDGARPLCPPEKIREVALAGQGSGAAILGLPVKPTLKQVDGTRLITKTLPRENIWEAQTPQVFSVELLRRAHEQAQRDGFSATDDSELVERLGTPVRVVPGDESNLKITTPVDLALAGLLLTRRATGEDSREG